jgi:hypothetical protein
MTFNAHGVGVCQTLPPFFPRTFRACSDIRNNALLMRVMTGGAGNHSIFAQRQNDVVLMFQLFYSV